MTAPHREPAACRVVAGAHLGVVWPHGIALLDSQVVSPGQAVALWQSLETSTDLTQFFAQLSETTGRGLLQLPSFAVAVFDGTEAHLAARGDFVVVGELVAPDGDGAAPSSVERITGEGVSTWVERRIGGVGRITLEAAVPTPVSEPEWPLTGGVTPASRLCLSPDPAAAPPVTAEPPASDEAVATPSTGAEPGAPSDPQSDPQSDSPPVAEPKPEPEPEPPPVAPVDDDPPAQPERAAAALFDDLWGDHTVFTPPEDAAVRAAVADADSIAAPDPEPGAVDPARTEDPGAATPSPRPASTEETWVEQPAARQEPSAPSPAGVPPAAGFISWVPRPNGAEPSAANDELGDHDGHTVLQVPEPQGRPPTFLVDRRSIVDGEPDLLLGVLCPSGHGNPPQRSACRICGARLDVTPVQMPRPSLGRLSSSTGASFELTGPVVVGRNPRASRFQGTDIPQLMAIPQAHVSASHLEIRLEGWSVLAVDLRSTNGTFLRRHADPPVRLPEAPQLLVSDDVLDLGHGVHLSFTGLP